MSVIKELIEEEKNAEKIIKDAEAKANEIILHARKNAEKIIKTAENDESIIKDLVTRKEAEIAEKKSAILKKYEKEAQEIEDSCKKNFEEAVKFVLNNILGV
ncbi:MAG: V-type ATPase subunit subunit G family protein [Thermoprotei archaeon]